MKTVSRRTFVLQAALSCTSLMDLAGLGYAAPCSHSDESQQSPFDGAWTYRSYKNIAEPFGDLSNPGNLQRFENSLFAEAILRLDVPQFGEVQGLLDMGTSGTLHIRGWATYGSPFTIRFQGVGTEGFPKGWVYDYIGFLVPQWPNGIEQVPAIVGSVVRTVPHSGGKAKAGFTASFIAVCQSSKGDTI